MFNAIQKATEKRAAKYDITADRVLGELAKIGFANIHDYIQTDNGDIYLDLSKLTQGATERTRGLSAVGGTRRDDL